MPLIQRELLLLNGPPWGFRTYEDENRGLVVHRIRQWSPAHVAKLREGDVILSINRFPTRHLSHLEAIDMIEFTFTKLSLLVSRHESMYNRKVSFADHKGVVQDNAVSKIQLNLKREPLTSPASPDMVPVPISKLMKEYDIPPRPESVTKKKRFANSEYFNDPNISYPTLEEKIEMAKKMADSLTAPINMKSKGANIFERQRQRIEKYVKEGPDPEPEKDIILPDGTVNLPIIEPPAPPNFPPIGFPGLPTNLRNDDFRIPLPPGAPKTLKEYLERIKKYPTVKHDAIGPEKCFTIAAALHNGNDKGSDIFRKIRYRSQKWEITSETIKQIPTMKVVPKYVNLQKPQSKLYAVERKPFDNLIEKINIGRQETNEPCLSPTQWRPVRFKVPPQS